MVSKYDNMCESMTVNCDILFFAYLKVSIGKMEII